MEERTRLGLLVLAVIIAVLLAWNSVRWMRRQLEIDACLDLGGCWDAAHSRCSNVQADCQSQR